MLYQLFTKKNIEILKIISKKQLCIRDIAASIKCSPGKVHGAVQVFQQHNIINQKHHKNMILISLNNSKLAKLILKLIKLEENI